jgi:integrating conjugative element protein (TIGR03759 family)
MKQTLRHVFLSLITALCLCMTIFAQPVAAQQIQNRYTPEHSSEIAEEQVKGAEWGLNAEEWQRYEELMTGPRGIYSPGIDPLTALGIEARSEEERRYFAELQVQAETIRVEKELAYQRAYDAAWKRLYPESQPVVNLADSTSTVITGNGRLAVFVKENCLACDQQIKRLQTNGQAFDIYLVDSKQDDTAVRRWASRVNIDVAKVRAGTITLNHDGGRWLLMGVGSDLPAVVRQVDGKWVRQ